jgi:hypothetical protein
MTKLMIRVTWHLTTMAFVIVGCALVLSGSVLHGDTARGIGLLAAVASTGFAALIVGSAVAQAPRYLAGTERRMMLHPGPILVTAVAVLAWVGVASFG